MTTANPLKSNGSASNAIPLSIENMENEIQRLQSINNELVATIAELDESLHLANGTADLALHHRDIAEQRVEELEAALVFIRDECDWEEPKGDFGGGGDRRIGPSIDKALDRAESDTPAKHWGSAH